MIYAFDTDVAKDVGVPAAAIYAYMSNLHGMLDSLPASALDGESGIKIDGETWIRISARTLAERMPCFNQEQVKRYLSRLVSCGYLKKAKLAQEKMDATSFYSL